MTRLAALDRLPLWAAFAIGVIGAFTFRAAWAGAGSQVLTLLAAVVGIGIVLTMLGLLAYTFIGKDVSLRTKMVVNAMLLGYIAHTVVRYIIDLF